MARKAFYSFHYLPDSWRAATVRNIGALEGNTPAADNDWEEVTRGGDAAIKKWIEKQMFGRSCTVVLVGASTANRKWINYEIAQSWNEGMGVVGVRIHGLKNALGQTTSFGTNPFDHVVFPNGTKLSKIAKCYDPDGGNSQERYEWIKKYLAAMVEEAIDIRKDN